MPGPPVDRSAATSIYPHATLNRNATIVIEDLVINSEGPSRQPQFEATALLTADVGWLEIMTEDWARDRLVAIYDNRRDRLVGFVDRDYAAHLVRLLEAERLAVERTMLLAASTASERVAG